MVAAQSSGEPLAGILSMATRHMLIELAEAYRRRSGQPVTIESVGGVDAARRIQRGEPFDFVVLGAEAIDKLASAGSVVGGRVDLARCGVAVAVKVGAPRPDVGNESAVRQTVLAAPSIGYSTGPSGAHLMRLFERWGIAPTIAARLVQAPPGVPVATLIARGEVELGFQQLSEFMDVPGIEVIGPLPPEIQAVTVFSGAVCAASKKPDASRALLSFLATEEAGAAKRRHGMEPL